MQKRPILFRTRPIISEFTFHKVCEELKDELQDIDFSKINAGDENVTMEDLVLDYFFDYKFKPVTQITGWDENNMRPEYMYEFKLKYANEFEERVKDGDDVSFILHDIVIGDSLMFVDAVQEKYKFGEYTEDTGELDDQIDDYLFEKAMDED